MDIIDIPVLNFISQNDRLPPVSFDDSRKSKRLPFIYSLLSKQHATKFLKKRIFVINSDTLKELKVYISQIRQDDDLSDQNLPLFSSITIAGLTKPKTYLFFNTKLNGYNTINLLCYENIQLTSWLGGVFETFEDLHISVQFNLDEKASMEILELYFFMVNLSKLKHFETIFAESSNEPYVKKSDNNSKSNIFQIDISNVRQYLIPATVRREHIRWQFCGPGRSILRKVTVKKTTVKEFMKRGKRI